jgi:23S rRNA (guanosine2251-2'-O)-methyltransferase
MGRNSRAHSERKHKHTDFEARVTTHDEPFLFDLLDNLETDPFLLILDNIQDPHNLGACLRSADGAGVHAVIAPKDRSVRMTSTVKTVACGAAEKVPFVKITNLARLLDQLKERGIWIVGTSDHADQLFFDIDLKGPLAVVMGSEGKGLRRLTAQKCDFLGRLPMAGTVESLNVSVSAGVCLYEAVRQRSGHSK